MGTRQVIEIGLNKKFTAANKQFKGVKGVPY